jgi:hypothetical protein
MRTFLDGPGAGSYSPFLMKRYVSPLVFYAAQLGDPRPYLLDRSRGLLGRGPFFGAWAIDGQQHAIEPILWALNAWVFTLAIPHEKIVEYSSQGHPAVTLAGPSILGKRKYFHHPDRVHRTLRGVYHWRSRGIPHCIIVGTGSHWLGANQRVH